MNHTFRIDVQPDGTGRIFVDGEDLSSIVRGFSLDASVDDGTVLTLQFVPGAAKVTGSGQALELTEGVPARFLVERLDPTAIEQEINGRMAEEGCTVGEAIVRVLRAAVDQLNEDEDD